MQGRHRIWGYLTGVALAAFALGACNVTKHLKGDERLLTKNSLVLKPEKKLPFGEKTALSFEMAPLFKQTPNERSLFLFRTRLWVFYKTENKKGRFGRWLNTRVGEPPTIYNDELAQKTARNFENYMRQRGYFKARSTYSTKFAGKHFAKSTYTLELGPRYTVRSVQYTSLDSNVLHILRETQPESALKPGAPIDQQLFEGEKLRITSAMKNRGYAFFVPNFVEFTGDSTGTRADVTVNVLLPGDTSLHKQYTLGDVIVFSDLVPDVSYIRVDTTIRNVYFAASRERFQVRPHRLRNAMSIEPGMLYRQEELDQTVRRLQALGVYRFVSLRPQLDSLQPDKINVTIALSPNKSLPVGGDIDLNYATSSQIGGLIGISSSAYFRNRNAFHGAESFQTSPQYNIEFDITNIDRPVFLQEVKVPNELVFPRFFDYLGFWRGLTKLRLGKRSLVAPAMYERLKRDGQTRFTLTYNYVDITNFYVYNLLNTSFGYAVRSNSQHQYTVDHAGIDILRPRTRPVFDSIRAQNPFVDLSFGNQLFTGLFLRSFNYTYSGLPNRFGERWYFRLNTELSGLEEYLLNKLWELPFGRQTWTISDLEFSKFARFDLDGGYTRDFARGITLATRLGAGIALPFGDTRGVPYVKQFFVGGPSSIRAWRIREIGPGGYIDPKAPETPPFYQASNLRVEFNAELRFPLFWWFKGAVFLDGGNIFSIDPDDTRPDARLRWDSYRNIALGTGFGVRGDFGFFILRFDAGLKLRNPYRDPDTGRYWVPRPLSKLSLGNFTPNLAVGYPF